MAYKDFKEYIQRNYYQLLKEAIDSFLATSYDGQGFHAYNVYSLLKTDSDNIQVCSLTCRDDIGPRIQVDVHAVPHARECRDDRSLCIQHTFGQVSSYQLLS